MTGQLSLCFTLDTLDAPSTPSTRSPSRRRPKLNSDGQPLSEKRVAAIMKAVDETSYDLPVVLHEIDRAGIIRTQTNLAKLCRISPVRCGRAVRHLIKAGIVKRCRGRVSGLQIAPGRRNPFTGWQSKVYWDVEGKA